MGDLVSRFAGGKAGAVYARVERLERRHGHTISICDRLACIPSLYYPGGAGALHASTSVRVREARASQVSHWDKKGKRYESNRGRSEC